MPVLLDVTAPEQSVSALGAELVPTTQSLADRLAEIAVTDVPSCEQAVLDRQQIGDAMKRVTEFFKPYKAMADKLHKALCDGERQINAPLQALDTAKRDAITRFRAAQDRERRQREQELADQQRHERERQATLEAAALEASGDTVSAAAVLEEAIAAPAPVVVLPDVLRQVDGLHFRRRWCWKYAGGPADVKRTPPEVLARALAMMPREFLCPDDTKIGGYARSMKGSGKIPGIEIYPVDEPVR